MQSYDWPGNVRELENAVEHALVLGDPADLQLKDLPVAIQHAQRRRAAPALADGRDPGTLEEIEIRCILQAMVKTGFNRTRAARLLGITRRTLGYRIHKYGLGEDLDSLRQAEHKPPNAVGGQGQRVKNAGGQTSQFSRWSLQGVDPVCGCTLDHYACAIWC